MVNLQVREPVLVHHDGAEVEVVDVWPTIQGEGPLVGCPAVFIRVAGCNMQCPGCDTDYTSNRHMMSVGDLVDRVTFLMPQGHVVVITGGEPLRQNIGPLVSRLLFAKRRVQLELSGTLHRPLPYEAVSVVCSPKTGFIHPRLLDRIDYLKYILDADAVCPETGLPTDTLGSPTAPAYPWKGFDPFHVFVQPKDDGDAEKNKRNLAAAVESCMTYGYRLGVQLHKIVGLA